MTTQISDRFNLKRFLEAQESVYKRVLRELRVGRKVSHWMWFIFPQIEGLGSSSIARLYAISGREEALAFVAHPVLGSRLKECAELVNFAAPGKTLDDIFGYPDNLKFRSSMTLFHAVAPEEPAFARAIERFAGGEPDARTLALL
ncbi:MAG: DUF1810 domain-containing protein [Acidobacteriaceae bacterium]